MRLLDVVAVIQLLWISGVISEFRLSLVPERLVNKKTGENFFIRCVVEESDGEGTTSLQWMRVAPTGMESEVPSEGRVRSKPSNGDMNQGLDLFFQPAAKEDAGTYKCVGSRGDEADDISISFSLHQEIQFVDCPTVQNPQAGTDAEIRCHVTADPMPGDITWMKDGKVISDETMTRSQGYSLSDDRMVLSLPGYDPETDDATYTVTVTQIESGDFQERAITVTGFVAPQLLVHPEPTTLGYEGKNLILSCSGTGRPEPDYKWFKSGSVNEEFEIKTSGDKYNVDVKGQLTIAELIEDDAISYTCQAVNTIGEDHKTTAVNVFMKPRIESIGNVTRSRGDSVSIDCKYSGDGDLIVEWIFKGRILGVPDDETESLELSGESPHVYTTVGDGVLMLNIDSLQLDDADEYQCRAENDAGATDRRVFLSVTHAPELIRHSDAKERALVGSEVRLYCEVEAVPAPEWTWNGPQGRITDSVTLSNGNLHSELNVVVSGDEDFGGYTCQADNNVEPFATYSMNIIQIVIPPTPEDLSFDGEFPNSVKIVIGNLEDLMEGQEPDEVVVYFDEAVALPEDPEQAGLFWNKTARRAPLHFVSSSSREYMLPDLKPETTYVIRAKTVNLAGESPLSAQMLTYTTSAAREPMAPQFVTEWGTKCETTCMVHWNEPDNQGADVTGFVLSYVEVVDRDGVYEETGEWERMTLEGHERKMDLYHLKPHTYYKLALAAVNSVGQGPKGEIIMRTGDSSITTGVSSGAIIGIVIVIIIIILVLVDVTCYYVNHCGVLMCLCVNLCGKENPGDKGKEIRLEEGLSQKNDDKTPLKQADIQDKERDNEQTPMVDEGSKNQKRDTTV